MRVGKVLQADATLGATARKYDRVRVLGPSVVQHN